METRRQACEREGWFLHGRGDRTGVWWFHKIGQPDFIARGVYTESEAWWELLKAKGVQQK